MFSSKNFIVSSLAFRSLIHFEFNGIRECSNFIFFFLINLFLATLGLPCCMWAFSSCGERGLLFVVVHGLLIVVASLVATNNKKKFQTQKQKVFVMEPLLCVWRCITEHSGEIEKNRTWT